MQTQGSMGPTGKLEVGVMVGWLGNLPGKEVGSRSIEKQGGGGTADPAWKLQDDPIGGTHAGKRWWDDASPSLLRGLIPRIFPGIRISIPFGR